MELTPLQLLEDHKLQNLPGGLYTTEVTSWNLHNGSYFVELTPWKLPHGTYTMEFTSLILHY